MSQLHNFLLRERATILVAAKQKALDSRWARITSAGIEEGWGIFFDEFMLYLLSPEEYGMHDEDPKHSDDTEKQGKEYLRLGYSITEAVQSCNLIYQAITESASRLRFAITSEEYQQLNLSLDTAIAEVVKEFEKVQTKADIMMQARETERLGFLAHELRNSLQSATIALEMIESGSVGVGGKTAGLLSSSLQRMAHLIDTTLTGVRLQIEPAVHLELICAHDVISEVEITAGFLARSKDLTLQIETMSNEEVMVDRPLFVSALSNLVQNALKFSHSGGTVKIRSKEENGRVLISVEDECGGLQEGKIEQLFTAGVQAGDDRTGVGLGLAISRQALERNNGQLRVENLPGKGCKFIIDLPKPASANAATHRTAVPA